MCSCFTPWNWISNNCGKYIFLVIWGSVNVGVFYLTYSHYKHSAEYYYLHEMLGGGLCLSRATASVINLNLGMLLLPMCRTLTTFLRYVFRYKMHQRSFRILIDRCKGFHIFCGWTLVLASVGHIFGHLMNAKSYSDHYDTRFPSINAASKKGEDPLLIIIKSVPGITGILLLAILSMILSSAVYTVRTPNYDLFWYTHRLYIVFYLMVLFHAIKGVLKMQTNISMHVPGCIYQQENYSSPAMIPHPESEPIPEGDVPCDKPPEFDTIGSWTWLWLTVPLSLYICDTLYRILCKQIKPINIVNYQECYQEVFELQLRKDGFACRPGQYILLQCPHISSFEWHPFTVTQSSQDVFTLHIKTIGDWSRKLQELFLDSVSHKLSPLYIDGPFSSPMEDILRYRISICVAGGIGITPFISILNHLRESIELAPLRRLYLIWIERNIASFLHFSSILKNLHDLLWHNNKPEVLNIKLFITSSITKEEEQPLTMMNESEFLYKRLHYGRPDWKNLLQSIVSNHDGKLGLFCCGPRSLTDEVQRQSLLMKSSSTTIHFYHESF